VTFIEFIRDELNQPYTKELTHWHGYSLFHSARYSDAITLYDKLLKQEPEDTLLWLYISSCLYYNQEFAEAREAALQGPPCDSRTRLLFHIAHQINDEQGLYQAHSELVGTLENQLSLAAIHYMRSHYQEAIEIYQRLLLQRPNSLRSTSTSRCANSNSSSTKSQTRPSTHISARTVIQRLLSI
jgi:intraflagellar transport protein 56